ncbi:sensor histidine kinase [Streptomyces sp. NPDC005423]|uniref:sensor histidine kinase n=1 Tax=Streptomyces sp. NPDC005423 TaxID=3155343 RepID=UPI0033B1758C
MDSDRTAQPGPFPDPPVLGTDPLWNHPFVARVYRAGQRLRHLDANRPWILDTGLVLAMIPLLCLPDLLPDRHHRDGHDLDQVFTHLPVAAVLALQAGQVLPLLWRRRRPSLAFAVIAAVFLVQCSLGAWLRAGVAVLIALYSLALHGRLRHLPVACAVTASGLGLLAFRLRDDVSIVDGLFFLSSTIIAAVALGLAVRVRRAQLAGLRERAARLEIERDQRGRLAVATERTRVAREMHDIVGHNLSVIITLADGGAYAADLAPERGKQALLLIGDTGRQALGELRRTLGVLREQSTAPRLSPQPGIADLGALCDRIRSAGPHVVYRTSGELDALDRGVQLAVYRIVQEALTNALKHGGHDTRVQLSLTAEPTRVTIDVHDSGPDTPPALAPPTDEGHGLAGMRERAALYDGTVTAGPAPGGGWTVRAVLDVTPLAGLPAAPGPGGAV